MHYKKVVPKSAKLVFLSNSFTVAIYLIGYTEYGVSNHFYQLIAGRPLLLPKFCGDQLYLTTILTKDRGSLTLLVPIQPPK